MGLAVELAAGVALAAGMEPAAVAGLGATDMAGLRALPPIIR